GFAVPRLGGAETGARQLAAAVDDEAVCEVVRRDGDRHAITGNHFDEEPTEPPTNSGEKRVALIALHAEVPAGERLHDFALNLNEIVSCHSRPFRRIPCEEWCSLEVGKRRNSYTNARRACRYRNAVFP